MKHMLDSFFVIKVVNPAGVRDREDYFGEWHIRIEVIGIPNLVEAMVYLTGKDEQGSTIQLEEDGTPHQHKTKQEQ